MLEFFDFCDDDEESPITEKEKDFLKINKRISRSIKALPSVDVPDRKVGEWKPFDRTWGRSIYYCTSCGQSEDVPTEMGKVIWKYCPNCGADMREGID